MEVLFATSNRNKFVEAAAVLKERGVTVKHFQFEHNEIRSDSLEEIAREAVGAAYEATGRAEGTDRSGGIAVTAPPQTRSAAKRRAALRMLTLQQHAIQLGRSAGFRAGPRPCASRGASPIHGV